MCRDSLDPNRHTRFTTATSSNHLIRSLHVSSRTRSELSRLIHHTNLERRALQKAIIFDQHNIGWDVHLMLCQPVVACHKKTKSEATHTTRVQAQGVCSPSFLSESSRAHNSRGQVFDLLPKRKAERVFVVVSFRPSRDHDTCLSSPWTIA